MGERTVTVNLPKGFVAATPRQIADAVREATRDRRAEVAERIAGRLGRLALWEGACSVVPSGSYRGAALHFTAGVLWAAEAVRMRLFGRYLTMGELVAMEMRLGEVEAEVWAPVNPPINPID